jgi:hypothetical protein
VTATVELDSPPSEEVLWEVTLPETITFGDGFSIIASTPARSVTVPALTAWLAHVDACPSLPGSPPFGSCVVRRVDGAK